MTEDTQQTNLPEGNPEVLQNHEDESKVSELPKLHSFIQTTPSNPASTLDLAAGENWLRLIENPSSVLSDSSNSEDGSILPSILSLSDLGRIEAPTDKLFLCFDVAGDVLAMKDFRNPLLEDDETNDDDFEIYVTPGACGKYLPPSARHLVPRRQLEILTPGNRIYFRRQDEDVLVLEYSFEIAIRTETAVPDSQLIDMESQFMGGASDAPMTQEGPNFSQSFYHRKADPPSSQVSVPTILVDPLTQKSNQMTQDSQAPLIENRSQQQGLSLPETQQAQQPMLQSPDRSAKIQSDTQTLPSEDPALDDSLEGQRKQQEGLPETEEQQGTQHIVSTTGRDEPPDESKSEDEKPSSQRSKDLAVDVKESGKEEVQVVDLLDSSACVQNEEDVSDSADAPLGKATALVVAPGEADCKAQGSLVPKEDEECGEHIASERKRESQAESLRAAGALALSAEAEAEHAATAEARVNNEDNAVVEKSFDSSSAGDAGKPVQAWITQKIDDSDESTVDPAEALNEGGKDDNMIGRSPVSTPGTSVNAHTTATGPSLNIHIEKDAEKSFQEKVAVDPVDSGPTDNTAAVCPRPSMGSKGENSNQEVLASIGRQSSVPANRKTAADDKTGPEVDAVLGETLGTQNKAESAPEPGVQAPEDGSDGAKTKDEPKTSSQATELDAGTCHSSARTYESISLHQETQTLPLSEVRVNIGMESINEEPTSPLATKTDIPSDPSSAQSESLLSPPLLSGTPVRQVFPPTSTAGEQCKQPTEDPGVKFSASLKLQGASPSIVGTVEPSTDPPAIQSTIGNRAATDANATHSNVLALRTNPGLEKPPTQIPPGTATENDGNGSKVAEATMAAVSTASDKPKRHEATANQEVADKAVGPEEPLETEQELEASTVTEVDVAKLDASAVTEADGATTDSKLSEATVSKMSDTSVAIVQNDVCANKNSPGKSSATSKETGDVPVPTDEGKSSSADKSPIPTDDEVETKSDADEPINGRVVRRRSLRKRVFSSDGQEQVATRRSTRKKTTATPVKLPPTGKQSGKQSMGRQSGKTLVKTTPAGTVNRGKRNKSKSLRTPSPSLQETKAISSEAPMAKKRKTKATPACENPSRKRPARSTRGTVQGRNKGNASVLFQDDLGSAVRIVCTGIEVDREVKEWVKGIEGTLVTDVKQAHTATHVIVKDQNVSRTSKLMIGLCCTNHIVTLDWLRDSFKEGKPLPFQDYFALDKAVLISIEHSLRVGKLLEGWAVYFCKGIDKQAPPATELRLIAEAAGSSILKDLNDCDDKKVMVITSEPEKIRQKKDVADAMAKGATKRTIKWFLAAIMAQKMEP